MGVEVIGSKSPALGNHMEAFIASFGMVALAELGDKTQLLSFVLATRFRGRPGAIIAGIFIATIVNHFCAAYVGDWVAAKISPDVMRWVLGLAFLGFAAWALIPDTLDGSKKKESKYGPLLTTIVMFFLAEMGDKTQLATVALGAKYASLAAVAMGTTLGMMVANIPAVLIGEKLAERFPLSKMRFVAAALFAIFGVLILLGINLGLGLGGPGCRVGTMHGMRAR
jgi:putative Ca2+/H+ antiporter (TMEM165/GDT1 family)